MRLSVEALIEEIRAAGTDNLGHFGNGYLREGGYALQQNPEELAAALVHIAALPTMHSYLEIGIASGGMLRFMVEKIGFSRVYAVDDRSHARAAEQVGNFAAMAVQPACFFGDSHSHACRAWIDYAVGRVDLAFIDGDHSYAGCQADLELVLPIARYVMFHDTVACEGVKRAWDGAIAAGRLRASLHVAGRERPLGIGIGEVVR